jgi:hypothetical protein
MFEEFPLSFTIESGRLYHTLRVANSDPTPGCRTHNTVRGVDLLAHIDYNKVMRFGQALFVSGQLVYTGYLDEERCRRIEQDLKDNPNVCLPGLKHTRPYR